MHLLNNAMVTDYVLEEGGKTVAPSGNIKGVSARLRNGGVVDFSIPEVKKEHSSSGLAMDIPDFMLDRLNLVPGEKGPRLNWFVKHVSTQGGGI